MDDALTLRLEEFKGVLTEYRDRQLYVYGKTYGDMFNQYLSGFDKDSKDVAGVVQMNACEQIVGLYRNIAMINRMIAGVFVG